MGCTVFELNLNARSFTNCFFKWAIPGRFIYVSFLAMSRILIVDISGIRTRIVEIEGKHSDHLTTTTAILSAFILE